MELKCLQGHPLVGDERKDVTGAYRCPECTRLRKKSYQPEWVLMRGARYRNNMKDIAPEDEKRKWWSP